MKRRNRSADQTKETLRRAAIRLLADRPAAEISVKDIAAEAGVNHGLVHRYFGTKEGLIREAIVEMSAFINRDHPLEGMTLWTLALLREHPEIARITARVCLEGRRDLLALGAAPPQARESYVRPVRAALERLGLTPAIDANVLNAAACAALLGWVVFRPLFDVGFGLPRDADERFAEIATFIDRFIDVAPPPPPSSSPPPPPSPPRSARP